MYNLSEAKIQDSSNIFANSPAPSVSKKLFFFNGDNLTKEDKKNKKYVLNDRKSLHAKNATIFNELKTQNNNEIEELELNRDKEEQKTHFLKFNMFNVMKFVNEFIHIGKFNSYAKKFQNLSENHLRIINDWSCENSYYINFTQNKSLKIMKEETIMKRIKKMLYLNQQCLMKIIGLLAKIPVLSANNKILFLWDINVVLIISYFLFNIPLSMSFKYYFNGENKIIYTMEVFQLLILVINSIMQLFRSYYKSGNEIFKKTSIFKHYMKKKFLVDVFSIISIMLHLHNETSVVQILFITNVIYITQFIENLTIGLILNDKMEGVIRIITAFLKIIYVSHLLSCLFYAVSLLSPDHNWVESNQLLDSPWNIKYLNSLYFIIVTLVTVGYGDITAKSSIEKMFLIFVMLTGCMIFAFNINNFGHIFQQMFHKENQFESDLKILTRMMKKNKINSDLQNRVRNYYSCISEKEKVQIAEKELSIFGKLSSDLQKEIVLHINAPIVKQSKFLCNNFTEEFLQNIVLKIKSKVYSPEEVLFNQGKLDPMIFFIVKGRTKSFLESKKRDESETVLFESSPGESLGELNLLVNKPFEYSTKSVDFCTVSFVSRADFMILLEKLPIDKERFCMLRDLAMFDKDLKSIQNKCKLCLSCFHLTENCSFINVTANRMKVIFRKISENKHLKIERRKFERRLRKSCRFCLSNTKSGLNNEFPYNSNISLLLENEIHNSEPDNEEKTYEKFSENDMNPKFERNNNEDIHMNQEPFNLNSPVSTKFSFFSEFKKKIDVDKVRSSGKRDTRYNARMKEKIENDELFDFDYDFFHIFSNYLLRNNIDKVLIKLGKHNVAVPYKSNNSSTNICFKNHLISKGKNIFKTNV